MMFFIFSVPGSSFKTYGEGTCLEDLLPKRPDLLILEHLPYMESEEISPVVDAQSLLNRMKGQAPVDGIESAGRTIDVLLNRLRLCFDGGILPPIIFMNMHRYDV